MIAGLMGNPIEQEGSTASDVQSTATSTPTALPTNTMGHPGPKARVTSTVRLGDPRLLELGTKWRGLGIGDQFNQVHHFASPKFSGKRERLEKFIEWREVREIRDENAQTLWRALDVARRVQDGQEFTAALKEAWTAFPTVTR